MLTEERGFNFVDGLIQHGRLDLHQMYFGVESDGFESRPVEGGRVSLIRLKRPPPALQRSQNRCPLFKGTVEGLLSKRVAQSHNAVSGFISLPKKIKVTHDIWNNSPC